MLVYTLRRILLAIPTLLGITLVCFVIINMAPGSPIDQKLQAMRFGSGGGGGGGGQGERAVNEKVIEMMKAYYGFDKPVLERYWIWLKNIAKFDLGRSYVYEEPAAKIIMERIPISLQFGVISLILTYVVCIFLGIAKAIKNGSTFDVLTSSALFITYSIPPLIMGILLIVFVAGRDGSWFPLGGITSENYYDLSTGGQIIDRIRHMVLPLICYMIGSFTFLTMLMKNSMLEVIKMDYIRTARAKGLGEKAVYFRHAFRNALIPIVTGMSGILTFFFAGSIIVEQIFSIDGMGLLSYTSLLQRDYPVIMAMIFVQSVLYMIGKLFVDVIYVAVDPRIDFT